MEDRVALPHSYTRAHLSQPVSPSVRVLYQSIIYLAGELGLDLEPLLLGEVAVDLVHALLRLQHLHTYAKEGAGGSQKRKFGRWTWAWVQ